jgi:mannose-6-phosphate isomerase-like protein (cupin superfamily)
MIVRLAGAHVQVTTIARSAVRVFPFLPTRCVMQLKQLTLESGFEVAGTVRGAQAAQMVLAPGGSTGGPDNRHRGSDQWLYVVSGTGVATVEGEQHSLRAGTLLLIEHGETHEIRVTGAQPLSTVNFYSPPAYTDEGAPLPAGKD